MMDEQEYLADPLSYDLEAAKLARKRRIAQQLIATQANEGMTGQSGIRAMGGPGGGIGAALSRAAGHLDMQRLDAQEKLLAQQETGRNRALLQRAGIDPDLATANPTIRGLLEAQAKLMEGSEQAAANRVEAEAKAEADRSFRREEGELNRQNRIDLRQTPTVHITNSGNPGAGGFGGAAPQIGIDPRTDAPIYRHTKSGQLFQYGQDGQPIPHEGAIAPKPAAAGQPTESERSSAGYLGRMQAAEKNLGNAQPFSLPTQMGLDRAPNATNFVLSPEQQVQRQQQEDWVRAKLRKESGAVIGDQEMAREIRTYFPMAGDKPEVIKQKAQSRMQAQEQMISSAGRAKPTQAAPVGPAKSTVAPGTKGMHKGKPVVMGQDGEWHYAN